MEGAKIAMALFGSTSGKSWIYRSIRRPRWKGQKPALNPPRPTGNHRRGLPRQLSGGLQREAQIRSQLRSVPILIPSVLCLGFEHKDRPLWLSRENNAEHRRETHLLWTLFEAAFGGGLWNPRTPDSGPDRTDGPSPDNPRRLGDGRGRTIGLRAVAPT